MKYLEILKTKQKLIIILLVVLFLFKCTQSCVRDNKIENMTKIHAKECVIKDSIIRNYRDTVFALKHSIDIEKIKANESDKRANDLIKQQQLIKTNNTITIKQSQK